MRKSTGLRFLFLSLVAAGLLALAGPGCSRRDSKARHLEQAEKYFDAGQYDQAEIEYLNVLHLEPRSPEAIGRLGQIYFDEGRAGQFVPFLLKGSELQPDNLDLRLKVGFYDLSAGKPKAAREEAIFILDRRPQDADAPLLLAEAATTPDEINEVRTRLEKLAAGAAESAPVLVALGTLDIRGHNFKEAEAAFKRAQVIDPKSSSAWAALGALYWAQKDLPQAEKALAAAADVAPARSSIRMQYARFEIQTGKVEAGRRLLREMTEKTPDYLPAWMLLAELAAREKKFPESAALVARVLARDPVHLEALLLDGQLKLESGEPAKAVARLEGALKLYPQSALLRYQLGLANLGNGDVGKAAASLGQAISLAPDYADAVVLLAGLNLRRGDTKSAIIALKQLAERHPDSLPGVWLALAEAYRNSGDLDEAVAVYRRLEKSFPGNPQTSWLMGLILVQQNHRDEARQAFDKALELSPDYLPALEQLVGLDVAEKKYPEALQRIDGRLEKSPSVAGLHLLRARVYLAEQDTKLAEGALLKALELQPDSPTAYFMLARLYVATNQQPRALARLREVVAKNPKDVEALMLIAGIDDQQKDYADARDTYEKVLALNPRFSPALNNLAYLYSERFKQLDKAYDLARRARELLPNEPHMADTLGWILYQKRQYPWALSLLEESAGKLPGAAEVQFHLGMAHYMMGEEGPARLALQRALQLNQDFPGKDEAGQHLALLAVDATTAGADVRAALEKAVADRPDDPVALLRLATIYEKEGAIDKAIEAGQAALKANPKNVGALLTLARLDAGHQEKDKAYELAKAARQLAPDDPEVAHLLGRLAYGSGNHPWALTLLQESEKKLPDEPEVLFDLALAFHSVGKVSEAGATMGRALDKNPLFPHADEARRFLEMLSLSADPVAAVAAAARVDQVLKSSPADGPALMALAAINEQRLDVRAAEQTYEKMLASYPEFAPAMKRLAILYAGNPDDNQKALDLATKAREMFPSDPELAKVLGIAVYRQGNFPRAVTLLKEGAAQRSDDAELMFYLGMAHAKLKEQAESKQALQRALDLNLREDLAAEARRSLAEAK